MHRDTRAHLSVHVRKHLCFEWRLRFGHRNATPTHRGAKCANCRYRAPEKKSKVEAEVEPKQQRKAAGAVTYEQSEDDIMWVPPSGQTGNDMPAHTYHDKGQTPCVLACSQAWSSASSKLWFAGDGKTALNAKLGY